jgi:hypothetical protein
MFENNGERQMHVCMVMAWHLLLLRQRTVLSRRNGYIINTITVKFESRPQNRTLEYLEDWSQQMHQVPTLSVLKIYFFRAVFLPIIRSSSRIWALVQFMQFWWPSATKRGKFGYTNVCNEWVLHPGMSGFYIHVPCTETNFCNMCCDWCILILENKTLLT